VNALSHITSSSGHVWRSSRADVADSVVAALRPIVEAQGGRVPSMPDWYLSVWRPLELPGAAAFQVAFGPAETPAGKLPFVVAVGCWDEPASRESWAMAHETAAKMPYQTDQLPADPPPVPWLSATLGLGVISLAGNQVSMLGDFERCVLWTMVEVWPTTTH
jgi:hypothetical protein